ncbi:MAG: gamma-glutamylcyclotransferase [Verrucomicrobia bacterium]|nr:gamma-glutamylcyclotransferase [Verrucomicrobiota bacterium]MDA1068547.1 gamma-glutamylcyclotransferase [Verrucomicrobiota bacterium]
MKSKEIACVFVYGTLKPGGFYHDRFCGSFHFETEEAFVDGRLFDFPHLGYPGALQEKGSRIRGFILRFSHPETEVLAKLDMLEGYDPERTEDLNEYYRKRISVFKEENDTEASEKAWCYFMTLKKIESYGGVWLPNGSWPIKTPSA